MIKVFLHGSYKPIEYCDERLPELMVFIRNGHSDVRLDLSSFQGQLEFDCEQYRYKPLENRKIYEKTK